MPTSRQSPPITASIHTGSGSSITSDISSSSCYYNSKNGKSPISERLAKINANMNDMDMDDRQQLSLATVGGYVDDLMERIRKMPPKKRSKFYQMLDEERLKDLNNNNQDTLTKTKQIECDDDNNEHRSMKFKMPLMVAEVNSDEEEDRTLIELSSNPANINDNEHEKSAPPFMGLNDKNYEELLAMGVPLSVLKAIALQHQQQAQALANNNNNNNQLSNFLTSKCTVSSPNSSTDNKRLLNARTILRRILQQQEQHEQQQHQHSTNDKSLPEPMDYTTDEETGIVEDEDDEDDDVDDHPSSKIPRHRNSARSNSHNPVAVVLNSNAVSSLSPLTSTSSSPDQTEINHQSNTNPLSRPSSTPAALVSSACSV